MNKTIRNPLEVYSFIRYNLPIIGIEWIPYSQITNLKKIAEGGFSIIYKATWEGTDVAVKKLHDSQNISKHFLNEVTFTFYTLAMCFLILIIVLINLFIL
jgi:serine/threonine protein kinase